MPPRRRCHHCHASQKKCDGQRPTCSRCSLRRLDCAYAPSSGWTFVDQNVFSVDLSRRGARRRDKSSTDNIMALDILPPPTLDLDQRVLDRFMCRWSHGLTCLQDSLRTVYQEDSGRSAMPSAILAVAYADLTVFERHGDRAIRSFIAYSKAISRIKAQIDSSKCDTLTSDIALAAILIIDAYEILYLRRYTPLGIHTTAIATLLDGQHISGQNSGSRTTLGRVAGPRVLGRQLLCKLSPLCNYASAYDLLGPHVLDQCTMEFVNKTCRLLYSTNIKGTWMHGTSRTPQRRPGFFNELERLLNDAESCFEHDPAVLPPHEVDILSSQSYLPPFMSTMSSALVTPQKWVMRDWILYHMCRIRILDSLIGHGHQLAHCIDSEDSASSPTSCRTTSSLLSSVDQSSSFLLKCTPFLLGFVDAEGNVSNCLVNDTGLLIAQYPLWMVLDGEHTRMDVKHIARRFLEYIDQGRNILQTG